MLNCPNSYDESKSMFWSVEMNVAVESISTYIAHIVLNRQVFGVKAWKGVKNFPGKGAINFIGGVYSMKSKWSFREHCFKSIQW